MNQELFYPTNTNWNFLTLTPPEYKILSNVIFGVFFKSWETFFRKGSHSHHYILLHHLHPYQCILIYLHLTFPHKGCHPYLHLYYVHRYLWRPHWCLKSLFLLHLWSLPSSPHISFDVLRFVCNSIPCRSLQFKIYFHMSMVITLITFYVIFLE